MTQASQPSDDGNATKIRNPKRGSEHRGAHRNPGFAFLTGPHKGEEVYLRKASITIGRGPGGVDLVLDDPDVSRKHAVLKASAGGYRLKDLESTNGTTVNGTPVSECELKYGDRVVMGGTEMKFILEDKTAKHPARTWTIG